MNLKAIIAWCIYDWGISAFPVIVTTFVIATYFTSHIAANEIAGTHQWGNAMALSGIIIAVLSPIFGAIAQYNGRILYWLGTLTSFVIISAALLWYAYPGSQYQYVTLTCVVIGTVALNVAMVFYNAMLSCLAPQNYIGRISGWGWGLGYLGGLAALMLAYFGLVQAQPSWLPASTYASIRICGPLVALWILIFALPLFIAFPHEKTASFNLSLSIRYGLKDLFATTKMLFHQKTILTFLLAQMIYIDGLNTLFAFGGIYAAGTFHMNLSEILLFGIMMNASAGIGSLLLAWVDDAMGAKKTILLSLIALTIFGASIVIITSKTGFWILSGLLCLFVGTVQSSSRSFMTHLVPKEKATELFGFYILSGKISTFLGPWLLAVVTQYWNSQRAGMASVLIFFIVGGLVLLCVQNDKNNRVC